MFLLTKDKVRLDHAQHVYRNEEVANPPPPRTQVYCGNLPRNMLEIDLFPYFSSIGEIYEFRLMMEFSGFSRGFCFVTYMTEEHADQAVRSLHGYILQDRELSVYKSWDNSKLFIYGIPTNVTPQQVRDTLKGLFPGIINVISKSDDKRCHKGWAFLEFDNHRNASTCRKQIWPSKLSIWGATISAEWARPRRAPDLRHDSSLLLQHLSADWTKSDIYELIKFRLKSATLLDIYKKIGRTVATLEFNSMLSAASAFKQLKGLKCDGKHIIVCKQFNTKHDEFGTNMASSDGTYANAPSNGGRLTSSNVFANPDDYHNEYEDFDERQFNSCSNNESDYYALLHFCNMKFNYKNSTEVYYTFDDAYNDLFADDVHYKRGRRDKIIKLEDFQAALTFINTSRNRTHQGQSKFFPTNNILY